MVEVDRNEAAHERSMANRVWLNKLNLLGAERR